jgi:glycosyltransferase involved in cell wall biosynthesis
MNICVILPGMPADEKEWFLPYLTDYLCELSKHAKLHVYTLKHPAENKQYTVHGIAVTAFNKRWIALQRQLMNSIIADHEEEPFTHVHAVWANSAGFFGAMAARKLNTPYVVTIAGEELVSIPHINYGAMRKKRTRLLLRYALSTADIIIAASSTTKDRLITNWRIAESKIRVLFFGVDRQRLSLATTEPKETFRILAVGGLIPVKRHWLLLESFAILIKSLPNARLTIIGDGSLKEKLSQRAYDLEISDKVEFTGWLHHETIAAQYRKSDVLVITSYHEEIPVVLVEALASGLPVVSVNVGIAYDLAEGGKYHISIADANATSIAEQLLAVNESSLKQERVVLDEDSLFALSVEHTVQSMIIVFNEIAR